MLGLVANIDRNMLKTRVTLENISLALLNLIKRFIFVMFKVFFPQRSRSLHSYFLFSSPITAASRLSFCTLTLPVWLVSWYVFYFGKRLFTWRLRIALVFAILTIAPLISESLLGNAPVNGNSLKVSGHLFTFLYLILILIVPNVNLPHIHVSTYPQNH